MKTGDRVVSLWSGTYGKRGTLVKINIRKANTKNGASPGWLHKVKMDDTKRTVLYHEKFLKTITPLEELL